MRAPGHSGTGRDASGRENGPSQLRPGGGGPPSRKEHIDQLLGLIHEATLMLKGLLIEAEGLAGHAPPPVMGPETAPSRRMTLVSEDGEGGPHMLALLFGGQDAGRGEANLADWERSARTYIRKRFASIGHVGAGVFLRLLRTPGEFVSQDELMRAAGVKSGSRRVIKVYICRLRCALAKHDLPAESIETGWRSYRVHSDAVPGILRWLRDA
ncbi:MAG: helix-turn-helix domain-containing protein [Sphingomonadales bacterium]|nr:helix-turn-helix domain-containing protein [Sphingomonadales bacterium]